VTEPLDRPAPTALSPGSPAAAPAATIAERWRRFDRWTSTFFACLAAVTLIAALTVLTAAEGAGGDVLARLLAVTIAEILVLFLVAVAQDRGAPWGRPAAVGLLLVIVASDAIRVVVDLTLSTITIPLAGLAALYLLSIRPGPVASRPGRERWIALAVVGLFAIVSLVSIAPSIVGPGSTVP